VLTAYEQVSMIAAAHRLGALTKSYGLQRSTVWKAGLLVKQKCIWFLKVEGHAAYAEFQDPEVFYKEAARLYREWKLQNPNDTPKVPIYKDIEEESVKMNSSITFE
jgi:hypothetical protein